MTAQVLLSWSSGKDSAWTLYQLQQRDDVDLVGLLTTFNADVDRVAMHGVRHALVIAQAQATGLPLWPIPLPYPCSNEAYEQKMRAVIDKALRAGVTHVAFGDLFLEDIRVYRERMLSNTGIEPMFPLWCSKSHTSLLARQMIDAGLRAVLTCVDTNRLGQEFSGRQYDEKLLMQLPAGTDSCGEFGEFHTFCYAGPMFNNVIDVRVGNKVIKEGFCFADLNLV